VDDSEHEAIAQFFPTSRFTAGGSDFVLLNGVPDSPSHELWEIAYLRTHYSEPFRLAVDNLRDAIDSIEAPELSERKLKLFRPALVEGSFRFEVEGPAEQAVTVQYSVDGVNWTDFRELTLGETPQAVVDDQMPRTTHRFYRAVVR